MSRVAFKMQLHKGKEAEYKKRHDEIWPELSLLLKSSGVSEYSIFLDESTGALFGVLDVSDPISFDLLPEQPVMKKWWKYIADIMDTNHDDSPVTVSLKEMFFLR